MNQQTVDWV